MTGFIGGALFVLGGLAVLHFVGRWRFGREVTRALHQVTGDGPDHNGGDDTAAAVPEIIAQFARKAGVPATPVARGVLLRQAAELRMGPDKPWRRIAARQGIAVRWPAFVWDARQYWGPVLMMRIVDGYLKGAGVLKARLFGSIPVADYEGAALDRDELLRYLAELAWAPDALLYNKALKWRVLGSRIVEVSTASEGEAVAVRLYFNDAGDIAEIRADARGGTADGKTPSRPWVGRFHDYGQTGGRRIPTRGEVGYIYEHGYAAYWRGRITDYRLL